MTPKLLREKLISKLNFNHKMRVLDPSVGTGEFLKSIHERFPEIELHGWDIDPNIIEVAKQNVPTANFEIRSALDPYLGEPFDMVIGNPPYFEFKPSPEIKNYFGQVIGGRPNIYALFFQVGLSVLKPGGQLGYVVPPSMNAGAYFKSLRKYLIDTSTIETLEIFKDPSLFEDAQTSVQLITLKNSKGISNHVFSRHDKDSNFRIQIFVENVETLLNEFENRSTLEQLGYTAITGDTVWNQHKDLLTDKETSNSIPLLYARNIVNGKIELSEDPIRKQYIQKKDYSIGPAIISNRIVGTVGKGSLRIAKVPKGYKFASENHLNVIVANQSKKQKVNFTELYNLLNSPNVSRRIQLITGNTQISATELNHLIPLDF